MLFSLFDTYPRVPAHFQNWKESQGKLFMIRALVWGLHPEICSAASELRIARGNIGRTHHHCHATILNSNITISNLEPQRGSVDGRISLLRSTPSPLIQVDMCSLSVTQNLKLNSCPSVHTSVATLSLNKISCLGYLPLLLIPCTLTANSKVLYLCRRPLVRGTIIG